MNTDAIRIDTLEFAGEEFPKFHFGCSHFGQTTFIRERCREEGIASVYHSEGVGLFAKTKIDKFIGIVEESLKYVGVDNPKMKGKSTAIFEGKALICVFIKNSSITIPKNVLPYKHFSTMEDTLDDITVFTTDKKIDIVVNNIFKRNVPIPNHYHISRTTTEMKEVLLEQGVLV